jgi:anthranilate/para-aminobenzoate synthase component II
MRYHSLILDPPTIPAELRVTARTADGEVMAIEHESFPLFGVQYHPESIMTEHGRDILKNFLAVGEP